MSYQNERLDGFRRATRDAMLARARVVFPTLPQEKGRFVGETVTQPDEQATGHRSYIFGVVSRPLRAIVQGVPCTLSGYEYFLEEQVRTELEDESKEELNLPAAKLEKFGRLLVVITHQYVCQETQSLPVRRVNGLFAAFPRDGSAKPKVLAKLGNGVPALPSQLAFQDWEAPLGPLAADLDEERITRTCRALGWPPIMMPE